MSDALAFKLDNTGFWQYKTINQMKKLNAILAGLLLGASLMLLIGYIMAQDRTYTLKGTAEQMIQLRVALDQSRAPYQDVIKVQEWLIPQLIAQDQAFNKMDSVKAKGK